MTHQPRSPDIERILMAAVMDPADWQERHSPTDSVMVKIINRVQVVGDHTDRKVITREMCRRRAQDTKLADALEDADVERASVWVGIGYQRVTDGTSPKIANLFATGSEGSGLSYEDLMIFLGDVERAYQQWCRQAKTRHVNVAAVIDIVCRGMGARETDRLHRKRNGWSVENLVDGLLLFERLQGWKPWPVV